MLNHPTIDRLRDLGLVGMLHALEEQRRQPDCQSAPKKGFSRTLRAVAACT